MTASVIDHFGTFWTNPKKSISGTFAYLVWDDDALYYAGSMTDAELRSFGTKRNDHLWNGDVFELFLKPDEERPEYYEFQANPRGAVFEVLFPCFLAGTNLAGSRMLRRSTRKPPSPCAALSTPRATAMKAGASRGEFPGRPSHQPEESQNPAQTGGSRSAGTTTAPREQIRSR